MFNGPNGPCLALAPATPQNANILQWITTVHYPQCSAMQTAAPPSPRVDPATLAVQFWRTIPLPVPHPSIPPGYAITGKLAYLVTGGTTRPDRYLQQTPLGPLTIDATGVYYVDWGDPAAPGTDGPFPFEGRPYPQGRITHVYEDAATCTVTVEERWTATWNLAGEQGHLGGLQTTAAIGTFRVEQLQAVLAN